VQGEIKINFYIVIPAGPPADKRKRGFPPGMTQKIYGRRFKANFGEACPADRRKQQAT